MFEAEIAEQNAELSKKANEEYQDAVRQKHRDLLDEMVRSGGVDPSVAEEMMDQLRKDNNIILDGLERKRQKNLSDIEVSYFIGFFIFCCFL